MEYKFILSTESTVDMPYKYVESRNIPVLFYTYQIDGEEYFDDMLRDENALPLFYKNIEDGKLPSTSQINEFRYYEYFEELIKNGNVLHLCLSSGLTPSVKNAQKAAAELMEKYPDKKVIVIDTLCACSGFGLLLDNAADLRDAGKTLDEVANFVEENKIKIQSQFFSTDMTMFRRSGRVSGVAALAATVLGICPVMHLDNKGKIEAYKKVRGVNNAISETVKAIVNNFDNTGLNNKIFIANSNCPNLAEEVKLAIEKENLTNDIRIFDIGTIIASHCGKGTVAVFFNGKTREV